MMILVIKKNILRKIDIKCFILIKMDYPRVYGP